MTNTNILSDEQLADYQENGFLVVRNVLSPDETVPLRRIVEEQAECNAYAPPDWRRLPNTPQLLTALKAY